MPRKIFTQIQLPPEQPDCCRRCPLLGLRPEAEREKGKRESYCCLGIFTDEGFPPLKSKGITSSAAAYKRMGRKLHRPCDDKWDVWMTFPARKFPITNEAWMERRRPYELELERAHYLDLFKRHRNSKK